MMHNSPVLRRGPVTHVRVALLVASALASLMAVVPGAFMQQARAATPAFVALPQVLSPAQLSTAHLLRPHQAGAAMSIELVLAPNHQAQMAALAAAQYDPGSAFYHHWLGTGEFDQMFGPTGARFLPTPPRHRSPLPSAAPSAASSGWMTWLRRTRS